MRIRTAVSFLVAGIAMAQAPQVYPTMGRVIRDDPRLGRLLGTRPIAMSKATCIRSDSWTGSTRRPRRKSVDRGRRRQFLIHRGTTEPMPIGSRPVRNRARGEPEELLAGRRRGV